MRVDYAAIRKHAFSCPRPFDEELARLVAEAPPDYEFLRHPTGQTVFCYLTWYVKCVAEAHFGRSMDQLDVLDWGCGKGHVTYMLRRLGGDPRACDVRFDAHDSAFGQPTPILESMELEPDPLDEPVRLPYPDTCFDVVLSFGVLEHVQDDLGSLGELERILRPGGLFICVNLPYWLSWTQRLAHIMGDHYHDRLYSRRWVRRNVGTRLDILDIWHRQLLPKNDVQYPAFRLFERVDQSLAKTPLGRLATNIEFVAMKRTAQGRGS